MRENPHPRRLLRLGRRRTPTARRGHRAPTQFRLLKQLTTRPLSHDRVAMGDDASSPNPQS